MLAHLIIFATLAGTPSLLDDVTAAARLADLQARFAARPMQQSIAELEQLTVDAPNAHASGTALVWLGDLAHQAKNDARTQKFFAAAYQFSGETHRFAARGLGDVALAQERYQAAYDKYVEADVGASVVLKAELAQKRALASRLLFRRDVERAAWLAVLGTLAYLGWRIRPWVRALPLVLPWEVFYVLPIYALLIIAARNRDEAVFHALIVMALGSLALLLCSGLAQSRTPVVRAERFFQGMLVLVANVAVFYIAFNHTHLIDTILTTITMQTAAQG